MQLDKTEDPVDAVLCAYIALYWYQRPEDVTIYGDFASGYIVTPTLPPGLALRSAAPVSATDDNRTDLLKRLARAEGLLADAMAELTAIENGCVEVDQTLNVSPAERPDASGR